MAVRRLRVHYSPAAVDDIDNIFYLLRRLGAEQITAQRFVTRIRDRCRRIGNTPHGGRPRDDLQQGLRTVPFERRAVIAYRVERDCVRILNVFYGGRDYEALYRERTAEE
jgi:toxin ParE1/3/4